MSNTIRTDVYTRVTSKIIADLEQGVRTWLRPWSVDNATGKIVRPLRHNGIPYKGINVVMLWSAAIQKGYSNPIWLTFKQALDPLLPGFHFGLQVVSAKTACMR